MNILALDQSSRITGWAVFNNEIKQLIAYGKFNAEDYSSDLAKRLQYIVNKIDELVEEYEIKKLLIEDIQMQHNVSGNVITFKTLAEVIGVLEKYSVDKDIELEIIHSQTWKSKLNIKGKVRADQKRNAQAWVINTYGKKPTQDECDAICLGASYFINDSAF